jgi:hypothetical protein
MVEYKKRQDLQKSCRFPQFLFNELNKVKPEICEQIVGTEHDFYYDTILSYEKWEEVKKFWV